MTRFLLVAIGGALGSMARYGLGLAVAVLFAGLMVARRASGATL